MLIEIFSNTVYDQTLCDPSRGIESRLVPKTIISERGDTKLKDMYIKARDFLTVAIDNPYYAICTGGFYMLEIEHIGDSNNTTLISTTSKKIPEKRFQFKFNSLRDTIDNDKNITIHGDLIIDDKLNIISFTRDRVYEEENPCNTLTTEIVTDSTSTSGCRMVVKENNTEGCNPFVDRCQQEVPTDESSSEGADSVTDENPVELSENSFSVEGGTIDVSDPNLGIGSVEGSSFSVDLEKQRKHDEFFNNMSVKISRRNRQHGKS